MTYKKERENYLMKPIPNITHIILTGLIIISESYSVAANANSFFCKKIYNESQNTNTDHQIKPITDIDSFGAAMTNGMLLRTEQSDLFEIYRQLFLGDPNTNVEGKTLKSITDILAQHPELEKPHFREYEISQVIKVYEVPNSLAKYLKSQFQIAGAVRNNLLQIEANLDFWKKILDYKDPEIPSELQPKQLGQHASEAERQKIRELNKKRSEFELANKLRFEKYLNKMISGKNRKLLADLKNESIDYQNKAKALFQTLKYIQEWMDKKGRNTLAIRQAMVDLIHTVGFGNQATQALLKSKNALDNIEGLKKILDERDAVAMDLGFEGHFQQLQSHFKINFPTGLSKNENSNQIIQKLEVEVLSGPFSALPAETIRVRSLTIQEAPFRSCLGGSDCSTRTYFSKALDPNFNYFTMTDINNRSSGHVTVVLGEAVQPITGQKMKIGFVDKLQNVPNQQIPSFLWAVSMSLAEKGYKLGIPEVVGDHNQLSNMDTIRHFIANEIVPKLSLTLTTFVPHSNQYNFENKYSRAYDQLTVKIYEPIMLEADTEIKPGRSYKRITASKDLDKNKLIQDFLHLKNSAYPTNVLKYVTSGPVVVQLEKLGLFTTHEFELDLKEIIEKQKLPFLIRKAALTEVLLLKNEPNLNEFALYFKTFNDAELTQISSEIKQWVKSSDKRKKKFTDSLSYIWSDAISKSDIKILEDLLAIKLFDINTRDESGFSTLLSAALIDQIAVINWLLQNPNLDLGIKDKHGNTDVEKLRLLGRADIADLVEQRRPDSKSKKVIIVKERNADNSPIIASVRIDPGTFRMGKGNNKVTVTLTKGFDLMSVDTTQKMWKGVVTLANQYIYGKYPIPEDPSHFKGENRPVESVSHDLITTQWLKALNELSQLQQPDVQKKLSELFPGHYLGKNYRLLTEAEYEYVARLMGLSKREFAQEKHLGIYEQAWNKKNSGQITLPVGAKKPIYINGQPIYDIVGNVWKWVADSWDGQAVLIGGTNPISIAGSHRIIRGDIWENNAQDLLSGARYFNSPSFSSGFVGFRLASDINRK